MYVLLLEPKNICLIKKGREGMKIVLILLFLCISAVFISCVSYPKKPIVEKTQINEITGNIWREKYSTKSGLQYLITFPKSYDIEQQNDYPVILFLHSMEERGSDVSVLLYNPIGEGNGIAPYALNNRYEFITVSPLCPQNAYWPLISKRLNLLLMDIVDTYRVKKRNIYLTGVSMGGMGVWSLSMKYPDWFAAIAPISGGLYFPFMKENVKAIKKIPVWGFHDRYDPSIPLKKEHSTIDRLSKLGGTVKYTISEKGEHYIHEDIYNNGELFSWLLAISK
jgi:predicted peptidase